MDKISQFSPNYLSFFGDWRVVDEHEFMTPTAAAFRTKSESSIVTDYACDFQVIKKDLQHIQSTLQSPRDRVANKLQEINRETTEQLDRARQRFNAIESIWKENNFERYLDTDKKGNEQHLSHVDRKLAQAVREVVEMKRDAENVLMELTKSVASVDSLIGRSNRLKRSSSAFRHKANAEKSLIPMPFKVQLFIAAVLSFLGYTFLKYMGW